jgi:hypothetical protein
MSERRRKSEADVHDPKIPQYPPLNKGKGSKNKQFYYLRWMGGGRREQEATMERAATSSSTTSSSTQ